MALKDTLRRWSVRLDSWATFKSLLRRVLPRRALLLYYQHRYGSETDLEENAKIFALTQDRTFPIDLYNSEKVMIILVPEHNTMSGGIYSCFSIAREMRRLKKHHGYDVLVMTRPNRCQLTYFRNTNFLNSENVYRFEQICLCKSAKQIYLHIPEYAGDSFVDLISNQELRYLLNRDVHVNILNQNIKLMPDKEGLSGLRDIASGVSQSVAHHAYFTQAVANQYDLPTLLLPAYTDLTPYQASSFEEKEKLIIYSPDEKPYKNECLEKISRRLPDFKLIEIRDITFDRFMDYATRCMFSITFGEGFDGYLAQTIHQGGIGFAVYDDDFFPSRRFKAYENIFEDGAEMLRCICNRMLRLTQDEQAYEGLNEKWRSEYCKLYRYDEYVEQIKKLSLKQFEIWPVVQLNRQPARAPLRPDL